MLLHLPDGYTPELVRDALAAKIKTLPKMLRASLTWDQGPEMRDWTHHVPSPPKTADSRPRASARL
jgi:IS30 family transposase